MKKLRDEFDKLMTETEKQADTVKTEDFAKIEKLSSTCDIVIKQINKTTTRLGTLKKNNENESLFVAMKRAENQLQSLEEKLDRLAKDNTVRTYKFEPNEKLIAMLNDLKVLGHLCILTSENISKSILKGKKPTHCTDINVMTSSDQRFNICGSVLLPNKQIIITDCENKKLKLIDTDKDTIISELQLQCSPFDVTKFKADVVAVTVPKRNTIQFISVTQNHKGKLREVKTGGNCKEISYNKRDDKFAVTFVSPPKVQILDKAGTEIKCIEHDSIGNKLFDSPWFVALTPDMTNIYVTDWDNSSVSLISLNGDVKAVYKDTNLNHPYGIYVHTSGLVYVVGCGYHNVHVLDPESGEFKAVLDKKDGLAFPKSIAYCESENKMYIGMEHTNVLKVFQLKKVPQKYD